MIKIMIGIAIGYFVAPYIKKAINFFKKAKDSVEDLTDKVDDLTDKIKKDN